MSLVNLFNVPGTAQEWAVWSLSHADHHRQIIAAMRQRYKLDLPEYILDPIPFHALDGWLWNHQRMHDAFDAPLAIGGFDLTGIDVKDKGQVASWIMIHATDHQNAALKLNI